ncbi:MAG: hypothetical protein R3C49_22225 [Planctomycetaceae bacterium]
MNVSKVLTIVITTLLTICAGRSRAQELSPSELIPDSCVIYAEVPQPARLISAVFDHPLCEKIQSLDLWQNFTHSDAYRKFLTGRKYFEIQMGMDWRPAVEALTRGGIFAAFDAKSQGVVVMVRADSAETAEKFKTGILQLAAVGRQNDRATDEYRGVTVYKLDKGGAAAVGDWLILVNKVDPGRFVLDRLLDHQSGAASSTGTLSQNIRLQEARKQITPDAAAMAFLDLEQLRSEEKIRRSLETQTENLLAEGLVGGIQSTLLNAPWVAAELKISDPKAAARRPELAAEDQSSPDVTLTLQTPFSVQWIPEERHHYFGSEPEGHAPLLPAVPDQVLSLATWRDVSEMWLRAGDLFDENTNDQIANAEGTLTTLFAGRDFPQEILGSFQPQMGLIVARQQFSEDQPIPAIRLPAFALVLEMREPGQMTRELRRIFQSMIGFFNVVGAMEGRPQLEMNMRQLGNAELVTSEYIPEDRDRNSRTAPLVFNFSPSVGFAGSRFVLASTQQLAEQLASAPVATGDGSQQPNTAVRLTASVLQQILDDNREQLISQNMLKEGRSREEAETQIDLLLQIVGWFRSADLTLVRKTNSLQLNISLTAEQAP